MVKCKTNEVEQGRGLFVLVGAQNKNEAHCANAVVPVSEVRWAVGKPPRGTSCSLFCIRRADILSE